MSGDDPLARLPLPTERRIAVHVHNAAERNLRAGHPWLFANSIRSQSHEGQPGDIAVIFDRKRRFLAVGLYDPASPIRVRILQHNHPAQIDANFFTKELHASIDKRTTIVSTDTNGLRLVHGENDGLPGLIVDRYADTLVIKLYTWAWISHLSSVVEALRTLLQPERMVLRLSRQTASLLDRDWQLSDGQILTGKTLTGPIPFLENGLWFEADVQKGQKTGFFLDQRDNRLRVEELAAGKRVLNVFAYSGGFSLYAARGGASEVMSLDISAPALTMAQRNFELNVADPNVNRARHTTMEADAFEGMQQLHQQGKAFDLVVIDPPSFAKRKAEIDGALRAYARLTKLGLALLHPRGTLVQASCSSRITADQFFATTHSAARSSGKFLQELARTGHALDHPVGFREGAYLKCLFAEIRKTEK